MGRLIEQVLKFGVVGFIAFGIDYGVLMLLSQVLGMDPVLSAAISFIVSLIFNYLASMRFVLGKSDCMMVWLPFVNVVVATTLSLLIGMLLRRMSPKTFEVLCGGRG